MMLTSLPPHYDLTISLVTFFSLNQMESSLYSPLFKESKDLDDQMEWFETLCRQKTFLPIIIITGRMERKNQVFIISWWDDDPSSRSHPADWKVKSNQMVINHSRVDRSNDLMEKLKTLMNLVIWYCFWYFKARLDGMDHLIVTIHSWN